MKVIEVSIPKDIEVSIPVDSDKDGVTDYYVYGRFSFKEDAVAWFKSYGVTDEALEEYLFKEIDV